MEVEVVEFKTDHTISLDSLPIDILTEIFSFLNLSIQQLITIGSVSKRFLEITMKEQLWSGLWDDFLKSRQIASINEHQRLIIFNVPSKPQSCIPFPSGEDLMKKNTRTKIIEINKQIRTHKPEIYVDVSFIANYDCLVRASKFKTPLRSYFEWIYASCMITFTFLATLSADKIIDIEPWAVFIPLFIELIYLTYSFVVLSWYPTEPLFDPVLTARINQANSELNLQPFVPGLIIQLLQQSMGDRDNASTVKYVSALWCVVTLVLSFVLFFIHYQFNNLSLLVPFMLLTVSSIAFIFTFIQDFYKKFFRGYRYPLERVSSITMFVCPCFVSMFLFLCGLRAGEIIKISWFYVFIPMFLCSISFKVTIILFTFGLRTLQTWLSSLLQFVYVIFIDYVIIGWCLVLEGFKFKYTYTFIPVYLLLNVYWIVAIFLSCIRLRNIYSMTSRIDNYYV